jgi:thioredoxin-related protein
MKRLCLYTLLIVVLCAATALGSGGAENIRWVSFKQGVAQSKQTGKAMVIYFYSESCPSCTEMKKTTWKDTRVIDALNTRYTPVRVDVNKEQQIAALYKVYYLPTTWFIKPDGEPFGSRSGYIPADLLLKIFAYLSK